MDPAGECLDMTALRCCALGKLEGRGEGTSDNLSLQGLIKLEGTNVLIKVDSTAALEGQNKREIFERHIRDILGHKRPFKTDPGPNTTIALQC